MFGQGSTCKDSRCYAWVRLPRSRPLPIPRTTRASLKVLRRSFKNGVSRLPKLSLRISRPAKMSAARSSSFDRLNAPIRASCSSTEWMCGFSPHALKETNIICPPSSPRFSWEYLPGSMTLTVTGAILGRPPSSCAFCDSLVQFFDTGNHSIGMRYRGGLSSSRARNSRKASSNASKTPRSSTRLTASSPATSEHGTLPCTRCRCEGWAKRIALARSHPQ